VAEIKSKNEALKNEAPTKGEITMRLTKITSMKNIGVGLLALLVAIPLIYAQRSQPSGQGETGSRSAPRPAANQRARQRNASPVVVDRSNTAHPSR